MQLLLLLSLACLAAPHTPRDTGDVKIFCVGLTRTGSSSLAEALAQLGYTTLAHDRAFTPCLFPDRDVAISGRYDDVEAVLDLPTAAYFRALDDAYPNAKFILVRCIFSSR